MSTVSISQLPEHTFLHRDVSLSTVSISQLPEHTFLHTDVSLSTVSISQLPEHTFLSTDVNKSITGQMSRRRKLLYIKLCIQRWFSVRLRAHNLEMRQYTCAFCRWLIVGRVGHYRDRSQNSFNEAKRVTSMDTHPQLPIIQKHCV